MSNNTKPMLSVERELLEELRNVCGDPDLADEANAILYKPVFESQYEGMTQVQAQAVSDGVDEIMHGKGVQLYPRCTILKECNVKSSPACDAYVGAVAKPITRRICHGCVGLKREVFCCICDEDQAAPVAVAIPECMKTEPFTTIDRGSKDYKAGYNAAISKVAELNGLKS